MTELLEHILMKWFHCDRTKANFVANHILDAMDALGYEIIKREG